MRQGKNGRMTEKKHKIHPHCNDFVKQCASRVCPERPFQQIEDTKSSITLAKNKKEEQNRTEQN